MTDRLWPILVAFAGALVLTLILTPLVRELNRRLGMVDKPDARRINKTPIPRGGGVAIFISVVVTLGVVFFVFSESVARFELAWCGRLLPILTLLTALGYADDKFSLPPKLKLLGQIVVAALTWWWGGLGFSDLWPALPIWADGCLTIFWIIGAINAFNLIDGLDGLASGLALIALVGMGGCLVFTGHEAGLVTYAAFAGGLLGFLRYNYNPASVFLGDSGSMMIGYVVSVLPLLSHTHDSFLVSVGVPLLAMGVPIFDTSLAIFRRTLRRLLVTEEATRLAPGDSARVMEADHDHLHHRILRAAGLNQRRAAWSLYLLALVLVLVGLVAVSLQSKAEGLWLAALAAGAVVVFHDMARIELFDAGVLLTRLAHTQNTGARRRWATLTTPFYLTCDIVLLGLVFFFGYWIGQTDLPLPTLRVMLLVRVFSVFVALVYFRVYVTAWSRALPSNYFRLFAACIAGSVLSAVILYYWPNRQPGHLLIHTILYATLSFLALLGVRTVRQFVRDIFYAIDCSRLVARKDVSRILVYGSGLRYRAFRRELVRTTAANSRIIVGILDDDILLRGHYIGGVKVMGSLMDAPSVINRMNVDTVVIAFEVSDAWLDIIRQTLKPTGVKITRFYLNEKEVLF